MKRWGCFLSSDEYKPELFGKYILLEKLATGGMAEIYLAKAPGAENVSKFLAIKRILPQFSGNHEFVEMFKEEAKIAINLSHANVVSIVEFGIEKRLFFLAMQYVDGKNLRQALNRLKKEKKYFTIPQIIFIIKEAAKGLDHAHSCVDGTTGSPLNITHRDISPQNIMASYDGEVRIIDFGIAKAESKIETTRAGTLKGKFGYMSPEQAEGYEVDFRTDIFSLGIVLWELLANDRLFVANSEINTLKKIRECHIPSLRKLDPNIPAELERITMKALARDRTLRYQSAEELAQDLQVFLNKHFPEFTSRELSFLLKEIFLEERDSSRQKMIEFSKLQMQLDDKTAVTEQTQTVTETSTGRTNATDSMKLNVPLNNDVDNFNLEFDKEDIVKSAVRRKRPNSNSGTQSRISNITPQFGTMTNYPNYTTTTMSGRKKSFPWMKFLLTAIVGYTGYYFYNNPEEFQKHLTEITESQMSQSSEKDSKKETAKNLTPSDPFYNLLVTSIPSGATIYIDGKDTETLTPGQIRVPTNKPYGLRLEKDGYLAESKQMLTLKQGEEVRIQMNKKQLAYINVSVSGGAAAIYVNGKKISDRAPVQKYPVIANTSIRVQAFNPSENVFTEKTVTLNPNTVTQVHLNLKDRRRPSGRK